MKMLPRNREDLLGTFRTFGADGPAYEVVSKRNDHTVRIRVLDSGEELDYPVQQAMGDPEAE